MRDPVEIRIAVSRPPETIRQMAVDLYEGQKTAMVTHLLSSESPLFTDGKPLKKVILFAGRKQRVKDLARALQMKKLDARPMHSDLTQKERDEVMLDFRNGKVDVLVATDIVARGIDVDDIPLVINYDVPRDAEDYVHRIGRTARAESLGMAVTLVSTEERRYFQKIEQFLHKQIERLPFPEALGEAPEAYNPASENRSRKSGKRGSKSFRHNRGGRKGGKPTGQKAP